MPTDNDLPDSFPESFRNPPPEAPDDPTPTRPPGTNPYVTGAATFAKGYAYIIVKGVQGGFWSGLIVLSIFVGLPVLGVTAAANAIAILSFRMVVGGLPGFDVTALSDTEVAPFGRDICSTARSATSGTQLAAQIVGALPATGLSVEQGSTLAGAALGAFCPDQSARRAWAEAPRADGGSHLHGSRNFFSVGVAYRTYVR